MKQLGKLLSALSWLLVAGSVVVLVGGLFGRPLLLAAVPTGSMMPVLQPGDLILVLPTWSMRAAAPGDIAVFRNPGAANYVVHRIVVGDAVEGFVTRGDANPVPDPVRVYPREIAGLVPQWKGEALHLPRLGLLSVAQGPLSSPVVAGAALMMGIFLLVMDMRPISLPRMRGGRGFRKPSRAVLSIYLGMAGTVFLVTLLPAWMLSSRQELQYRIMATRPAHDRMAGHYVQGQPHTEETSIENTSPVPLVVMFRTDDPRVEYDPPWGLIPPHSRRAFRVTVDTRELGSYTSQVYTGVFLPLLPPVVLGWLARLALPLAATVTALVPVLALLGIAWQDSRFRMALVRLRMEVSARLLI